MGMAVVLAAGWLAAAAPDASACEPAGDTATAPPVDDATLAQQLEEAMDGLLRYCPRTQPNGKPFTGTAQVAFSLRQGRAQELTVSGAPPALDACIRGQLTQTTFLQVPGTVDVDVPLQFERHHGFFGVTVTQVSLALDAPGGRGDPLQRRLLEAGLKGLMERCLGGPLLQQKRPRQERRTVTLTINTKRNVTLRVSGRRGPAVDVCTQAMLVEELRRPLAALGAPLRVKGTYQLTPHQNAPVMLGRQGLLRSLTR